MTPQYHHKMNQEVSLKNGHSVKLLSLGKSTKWTSGQYSYSLNHSSSQTDHRADPEDKQQTLLSGCPSHHRLKPQYATIWFA